MLQVQKAVVGGDHGGLSRALKCTEERDWGWRGRDGRTVLELAVLLGQPEMVQLLVQAGAETDHFSVSGFGALHIASIWGQLDCMKELLRAGTNHRLETTSGESPQLLALRYGHTTCANYLSCAEARCVLSEAVQGAKGSLTNTELITGKWNKEDKAKVTALCLEKSEWLAQSEGSSEQEIESHITDFKMRMQPHLAKLEVCSQ